MRFRETHKVVVANAGIDGPVIYLTEDDRWTHELHEAEFISDEAHAQVRLLLSGNRRIDATDVRLADVCRGANGPELNPGQ